MLWIMLPESYIPAMDIVSGSINSRAKEMESFMILYWQHSSYQDSFDRSRKPIILNRQI